MAEASIDVAETKGYGQVEQDGYGHELSFDEIREETFKTEQQVWTKQTQLTAFCDICFILNYTKVSASYLCYLCKQYICARCSEGHDKSHSMVEKESTGDERNAQIKRFRDEMLKESESERMEMFNREDVSLVDRFSVKHKLDENNYCKITGVCGLDESMWALCDNRNSCIKVFSIGTHILQRYIRFGSKPHGVTAINVKHELTADINVKKVKPLKRLLASINTIFPFKRESSEQGVMAVSDVLDPNQSKPDKQCLLAVTLPGERRILFINLTQNPAEITKSIETKKRCRDIAFSGDQIVTLCEDVYPGYGRWFITVLSTVGIELKTINTHLYLLFEPRLAVCPGRFYLTDSDNHKVLCMNDEGKVVSHNTIEWSRLGGISVDPDTEKVYISGAGNYTVYRLDSRLESLESLFEFNPVNTERPERVCVHRDRVYVSHGLWRSTDKHIVSVVRVI